MTAADPKQHDARGFSAVMARAKIEIATAEHERLCTASADMFGHSGVTGLRRHRQAALHKRLRAELDAGK